MKSKAKSFEDKGIGNYIRFSPYKTDYTVIINGNNITRIIPSGDNYRVYSIEDKDFICYEISTTTYNKLIELLNIYDI